MLGKKIEKNLVDCNKQNSFVNLLSFSRNSGLGGAMV